MHLNKFTKQQVLNKAKKVHKAYSDAVGRGDTPTGERLMDFHNRLMARAHRLKEDLANDDKHYDLYDKTDPKFMSNTKWKKTMDKEKSKSHDLNLQAARRVKGREPWSQHHNEEVGGNFPDDPKEDSAIQKVSPETRKKIMDLRAKRHALMKNRTDKKQRITKPQNVITIPEAKKERQFGWEQQKRVALATLKMSKVGAQIMGGMTHAQARHFLDSNDIKYDKKDLEEADDSSFGFFSTVKPGHRVHYLTPQGQSRSGRVVMNQGTHLVLNRGDGQPQVVNQNNFIKSVDIKDKVRTAILGNVAKSLKSNSLDIPDHDWKAGHQKESNDLEKWTKETTGTDWSDKLNRTVNESTTDDHYEYRNNINKAVAALHKKLRKKYDENEDENRHSENAVLLAKHFGTPEELERMQHMVKTRDKIGHLHSDHTGWASEMSSKYYHKLKESLDEELGIYYGSRVSKKGLLGTKYGTASPFKSTHSLVTWDNNKKSIENHNKLTALKSIDKGYWNNKGGPPKHLRNEDRKDVEASAQRVAIIARQKLLKNKRKKKLKKMVKEAVKYLSPSDIGERAAIRARLTAGKEVTATEMSKITFAKDHNARRSVENKRDKDRINSKKHNTMVKEAVLKPVDWATAKTSTHSVRSVMAGGIPLKHHVARLMAAGIQSKPVLSSERDYAELKIPIEHTEKAKEILRGKDLPYNPIKSQLGLKEVSAPGQEDWILSNKQRFIDQYGKKKGLRILYAKAWKMSKEEVELVNEGTELPPIHQIARDIKRNWKKPYFGAVPYLDAMHSLHSVHDTYGMDSGHSVVAYGLSNMNSYSGKSTHDPELAKTHRALLKAHLKAPKKMREARESEYRANLSIGTGGADLRKKNQAPKKPMNKLDAMKAIHKAMMKARQGGVDEARMDNVTAREILDKHKARDADFHALTRDQVSGLLDSAKEVGYRRPSWASGSKGRMFHAHLQRVAKRQHQMKLPIEEASKENVYLKVHDPHKQTGMPSGWNKVHSIKKNDDGTHYVELKKSGHGVKFNTDQNNHKLRLGHAQGQPITVAAAHNVVNKESVNEASKAKVKKTAERAIQLAKAKKKGQTANTKPELTVPVGNATSSTLEGSHAETGDGIANH